MLFLKQSTASQSVKIGPFVDSTDGVTAETGLTIANTDIKLSKNGGTLAAKNSGGGTHDADGWYTITLDATDTDTVGKLQLSCRVAGACPVWADFHVLEEAIYDALIAASASAFDSSAYVKGVSGTLNTLDALDTAQDTQHSTTQSAISGLNDPTAAAIADAVLDEALSGHVTAGTLGKAIADIETDATAILADTNELQTDWTNGGRLDLIVDGILADTAEIGTAGAGLTDLGGMSTGMKAEVNAEMVDVIATDTYAEPGQGAPAATASLAAKINYLYKNWRNKRTQTATTESLYDDAGTTVDQKRTVSDDGTTATKGEVSSGP